MHIYMVFWYPIPIPNHTKKKKAPHSIYNPSTLPPTKKNKTKTKNQKPNQKHRSPKIKKKKKKLIVKPFRKLIPRFEVVSEIYMMYRFLARIVV